MYKVWKQIANLSFVGNAYEKKYYLIHILGYNKNGDIVAFLA